MVLLSIAGGDKKPWAVVDSFLVCAKLTDLYKQSSGVVTIPDGFCYLPALMFLKWFAGSLTAASIIMF